MYQKNSYVYPFCVMVMLTLYSPVAITDAIASSFVFNASPFMKPLYVRLSRAVASLRALSRTGGSDD